jgi:hypothetical protein
MGLPAKLRTFRSMDSYDRRLIVETFCVTLFAFAGIRLIGVPRTQRWLRKWAERHEEKAGSGGGEPVLVRVARAQRTVRRASGLDGTCLARSLSLWALLLKRGLTAEIRIGIRKNNGKIEGHAWVEYERIPVNELPDIALSYEPYGEPVCFDRRT